jgi:hypothetical protein
MAGLSGRVVVAAGGIQHSSLNRRLTHYSLRFTHGLSFQNKYKKHHPIPISAPSL